MSMVVIFITVGVILQFIIYHPIDIARLGVYVLCVCVFFILPGATHARAVH